MPKLAGPLVVLVGWWLSLVSASGQEPAGGTLYSRYRHFRIPFQTGPAPKPLRQLNLYVSADQGRTWHPSTAAATDQGHFRFLTERDGLYWFAVQTIDQDGAAHPAVMTNAQPSLKIIVDTQNPVVYLQPLAPRPGEVGVAWDIRDDNPDPAGADAVRLEYRPPGGQWLALPVQPGATQYAWNPQTNGVVEVRLRARDRAGNWGEATTNVSLAGAVNPPAAGNPSGDGWQAPPPADDRRLVNSKRISLNYDLKEVGPSGVSAIELWYTTDGRTWHRYPQRTDEAGAKSLIVEVSGEGVYGLTLVAKSGVGLGVRPPQTGDRPQVWVEVDMTKPLVQLYNVLVGQGDDKGKLTITWTARDKNLQRTPITLSYAEQPAGPWTPIVQNHLNTGRYLWQTPERVPYQFYVKVEAVDAAGNIGEAVTEQMVKVDLSQPKAKILNVGPAAP